MLSVTARGGPFTARLSAPGSLPLVTGNGTILMHRNEGRVPVHGKNSSHIRYSSRTG
jgi:hypothetical protein